MCICSPQGPMMSLRSLGAFGIALLLGANACYGQDRVVVHLTTNYPDAIVYADSLRLGPARWGAFRVAAPIGSLRLIAPGGDAWSIAPLEKRINAALGDTVTTSLLFPSYHRIESNPFGASAYLQARGRRTFLGATPVLFAAPEPPEGVFVVQRQGFAPIEITPGSEVWNRYVVDLQPEDVALAGAVGEPLRSRPRPRRWIEYSAATVAIVAGALSVHHKFKADRLNDHYVQTGDPALRPRIRTLDNRSAISLGCMQVGLATLALRFILK